MIEIAEFDTAADSAPFLRQPGRAIADNLALWEELTRDYPLDSAEEVTVRDVEVDEIPQ